MDDSWKDFNMKDLEYVESLTRRNTLSPLPEKYIKISLTGLEHATKDTGMMVRLEKVREFNAKLGTPRIAGTPGEALGALTYAVSRKELTEMEATACMLIIDLVVAHNMNSSDIVQDDDMDKSSLM